MPRMLHTIAWPALVLVAQAAGATTTARLPDWVCVHPDSVFADAFEGAAAVVTLPSGGSGGTFPGSLTRSVAVPGFGTRTYYLHVPSSYAPGRAVPLVFALHGQSGSAASAPTAAQSVRSAWSSVAEAGGFIVVAPVATGSSGGWVAPPPGPSDYDTFAAVIADVEGAYSIDRSRRIGWGFSAGGHVMHDLVLNHYSTQVTIDTFAGYAVSAGAQQAFACGNASECNTLVAAASRRIPVSLHVGTGDSLQPYVAADRDRFAANGWVLGDTLWYATFAGGHVYASAQLAEAWQNLCPFQALP